jgi:hypothetical protein
MGQYNPAAYSLMHEGVRVRVTDLKTKQGQAALHRELAKTDVLLTSFRPSALSKLGLDWKLLHRQYPALSQVAIVGAPGARAEEPGHDLTYLAEHDLVSGLALPPTLYADMGGSLMTSEAVLKAVLLHGCRAPLSCVDCGVEFDARGARLHSTCVSEAEKHQGSLYRGGGGSGASRRTDPAARWSAATSSAR